jgi:hypothetical protein
MLRRRGARELARQEIDLGWEMENHLNLPLDLVMCCCCLQFPSFVVYLRSSSSAPYSTLLLRVRKGELVVIFLHSGVSARLVRQAIDHPLSSLCPELLDLATPRKEPVAAAWVIHS